MQEKCCKRVKIDFNFAVCKISVLVKIKSLIVINITAPAGESHQQEEDKIN